MENIYVIVRQSGWMVIVVLFVHLQGQLALGCFFNGKTTCFMRR